MSSLFENLLKARGLEGEAKRAFLNPSYDDSHDPFLLPDMQEAVDRLVIAHEKQEKVTVYGDYDIDGLTATTILLDSFESFGFESVDAFIPNRFVEGYGLTVDAIEKIASTGANLIITVDCGSLSTKEIERAGELGVDVIVTDHHNVQSVQPPAVAVINPKRLLQDNPDKYDGLLLKEPSEHLYPFLDLAGCGVAFKLVQALQTKLDGLPKGQEKWLLDLVALGTVCDVVTLVDENRANVFYGLKVLSKARRPGLRALMSVSGVLPININARHLGFGLGPRMNAAGRLETAQYALDMLRTDDPEFALEKANQLDDMNKERRSEQNRILKEATDQARKYADDSVLVVSGKNWSHGIIGIVAARLLEEFKKPAYVLEEMESGEVKGSARSYGDFSAADAIRASDDIITKGGGHKFAAGVTLPVENIDKFRQRVNEFYRSQQLVNQADLLLPNADVEAEFRDVNEDFIKQIATLEPFGSGNPEPVLRSDNVKVLGTRYMGAENQHIKITVNDGSSRIEMLCFNAPKDYMVDSGVNVSVWYQPSINEWQGRRSVEGRLLHLEVATP